MKEGFNVPYSIQVLDERNDEVNMPLLDALSYFVHTVNPADADEDDRVQAARHFAYDILMEVKAKGYYL